MGPGVMLIDPLDCEPGQKSNGQKRYPTHQAQSEVKQKRTLPEERDGWFRERQPRQPERQPDAEYKDGKGCRDGHPDPSQGPGTAAYPKQADPDPQGSIRPLLVFHDRLP